MPDPYQPSWKMRRIAIFGFLILCAFVTVYAVVWGSDTELHRTALTWALGCAMLTVSSYAGFAVLEDVQLASILRTK